MRHGSNLTAPECAKSISLSSFGSERTFSSPRYRVQLVDPSKSRDSTSPRLISWRVSRGLLRTNHAVELSKKSDSHRFCSSGVMKNPLDGISHYQSNGSRPPISVNLVS